MFVPQKSNCSLFDQGSTTVNIEESKKMGILLTLK